MPFYSARAELDITSKIAALDHQGDAAWWRVVPLQDGVALHFALLNNETCPLGRIICAMTGSPVYHVEVELTEAADFYVFNAAESLLGRPYDYYGALRAWDDTGKHSEGKEFCSGYAQKVIADIVSGLQEYPNPGTLLRQVLAALGLPVLPMAMPHVSVGDAEMDYLSDLHSAGKISAGDYQNVLAVCQANEIIAEEGQ